MVSAKLKLSLLGIALGLFLFPTNTVAADQWVEVRSAHFSVSSNAGEKEARRIATQFEEIRAVFLQIFPSLRVDAGKPLIVIAAKNEDSLRTFLPDYWVAKDQAHPSGEFRLGLDRNFAVLRTDVSVFDENPYQNLYYEYTLSVLRLNFSALPTWLEVGLAQFYGNTVLKIGETDIGRISKWQLGLIKRSQLIPLETLMDADQRSPLVNERDRATIFYAESWLLVHYFINDPDARENQLLLRFLKALDETNDAKMAAKESFGDLPHLEARLKTYARQSDFPYNRLKPLNLLSDKSYQERELSPAEALAIKADFLAHSGHAKEAKEMFKQAAEQEPTVAASYVGLGYVDYLNHDNGSALEEFEKAMALDPQDFRPYHFKALLILRVEGYHADTTPQIIANLEKVVSLNPDFAPAYGFLSVAYRQQQETKAKALDAATKAANLAPATMAAFIDIGDCLLAMDRDQDAARLLTRLTKQARTANDKAQVESFAKRLAAHQRDGAGKSSTEPASVTPMVSPE